MTIVPWLTETYHLFFCSLPINPMISNVLLLPQFGYEGRVPLKSARLFYDISEKARKIVESYFMLNSTLYFSYTHLVCRTALSGEISESVLVPSTHRDMRMKTMLNKIPLHVRQMV